MEDKDFAQAMKRMVEDNGKDILLNSKAKAYIADYRGQFKNEANIFIRLLDAGCAKFINEAGNVLDRKRQLVQRMDDEQGISQKHAMPMMDLLGFLLKGDTTKCGEATPSAPKPVRPAPISPNVRPENRASYAKTQALATERPVPDGFVRINGGTFMMGSPANEPGRKDNEGPQHQVTVSGFYMGKYQVTQKEWQEVTGTNPSAYNGDKLPMECVSWYDVIEYCNKRSQKEGLTPAYTIDKSRKDPNNKNSTDNLKWTVSWNREANGYRLPTEAEWEYACRAGTTTAYNTGAVISDNTGWYKANSGEKTHPAGQKPANAWGLYDMHGNVWELCWDWHGNYSSGAQTNPVGASASDRRVSRGGSWASGASDMRSSHRSYAHLHQGYYHEGFRLVRH